MQYYYSKCTAVVAPSLSEGFCLPVVEAMMFGKPAIASSAGSLPELIDDGVNGFLVSPQNIALIAEKMRILMSDSQLVQQMGDECQKRSKKFTISKTSAALCKVLDPNKVKGAHYSS